MLSSSNAEPLEHFTLEPAYSNSCNQYSSASKTCVGYTMTIGNEDIPDQTNEMN